MLSLTLCEELGDWLSVCAHAVQSIARTVNGLAAQRTQISAAFSLAFIAHGGGVAVAFT